ncbi:MAG TPA: glycosyltransferase family 9 protein [Bacteroidales bacterium]|nr:glycosyltransferase family 9 protein [Bacteroidales bacterium]
MIKFLRNIDKYAGYIIVLFLSFFKIFDKPGKNTRRVLVIKLWALGDSILTLSLIKGIKESFKDATVDVVVRSRVKDVFECYPLDRIYNIDSFKDLLKLLRMYRKYDIVFDCEPYFNLSAILAFFLGKERVGFSNQFRSRLYTKTTSFRKDQHMVQNYIDMLRIFGKQYDTQELEKLSVSKKEGIKVDDYILKNLQGKSIIGITIGIAGSAKNRMWYEHRFAELADRIIELLNYQVIFIDGPGNRKTVQKVISLMKQKAVNTMGIFTLKETFYLISKCTVFICNDSGPMHIAAAQGCKTIGLFGPNTPVLWMPYGKGNIAIYKTKLKPAIQNDKGIFKDGNREGYMGPVTIDDVFDAVKICLQ